MKEALKLALEALEESWHLTPKPDYVRAAITTIKAALAQPAQRKPLTQDLDAPLTLNGVALYPQRTWVGLTDKEFQYCVELKNSEAIAEEVEAKLKEKNT